MSLHWKQQKGVLSLNAFFENSFHCPHLYTCMYILKIFDASCTNYPLHVQTTSKFNYRLLLLHEKIWNRNTDHLKGREWAESTIEFKLYKFIYRTDTENKTSDPHPRQTNKYSSDPGIFFFWIPAWNTMKVILVIPI